MDRWQEIFRTFLKGGGKDGKRCVDAHKGVEHVRSWEDASQYPNFGGVLKPGWVDISFDDADMSEAFLDLADEKQWLCMALKNPDTGHVHTYWKDTKHIVRKFGKDIPLVCGFIADIHGGDTYIPLRCLGTDRFPPVYDIAPEDSGYQSDIPLELYPVNTKIKLWGMEEGEGRNSDLYKYILVLQSQLGLDPDVIRGIYRDVINQYVLGKPLSQAELDVILRDESFDKVETPGFFQGNTFRHDVLGDYMMQQDHVALIDGRLHTYKDGVYVLSSRAIEQQMISLVPGIRKTQRREAMDYMELQAQVKRSSGEQYIAFNNGVYDITEDTLLPFSPSLVVTNKIPWDYNPDAYDELADRTLDNISCKDRQIRMLLEECIGACFYRSALLAGGKAFILTGDGANGKSTYLDMIKNVLGPDNISSLDLKEIGDRFSTEMIAGKLANIGDDISDDFLQGSQVSIFKKVVTGNRLKAERKGQDPFEFDPYCKLLFSANDIPRMKDKSGALKRRLVIIPFNAVFKKTDPGYDPYIITKLKDKSAAEYLIQLGIKGLKRVKENNGYTIGDKVQKQIEEYELENNPILGFIQDVGGVGAIVNEETADVFRKYQMYCADAQQTPMSRDSFTKQINKRLKLRISVTKINGKSIRIFRK